MPQFNDWVDVLIHPNQMMYLDSKTLINLRSLCKIFHQKEYHSLWWTALSNSVAKEKGLYFPLNIVSYDAKQYFFEEIWPARNKFSTSSSLENNEEKENSFSIKVSARFRPGIKENDNLSLPLHQFLKIQRKKMKALKDKQNNPNENNGENSNSDIAFVGEDDPEEFCCPLLGTLLKDPVLLKTSNKIISRSVAIQCILRQGKDPFNNMKLTMNHLEEQVELANKIDEWRHKKAEVDVSLKREDVLNYYISDNNIDPEILATLVEAERLQHASNRAVLDAKDDEISKINNKNFNKTDNSDYNDSENNPETNENIDSVNQNGNDNLNDSNKNHEKDASIDKNGNIDLNNMNDDNIRTSRWRKGPKETAKVVDINSTNRSISMAVPGAGIRPFHFSNVYSGNAKQSECYSNSVQNLVTAVLNGNNTAFVCYGQTGSGKTYAMFGPEKSIDKNGIDTDTGVVIRTCKELIEASRIMSKNNINIQLSCSFIEIYNEDVTCLLSGNKVQIRRGNGELVGANEQELTTLDEALSTIRIGQARKTFAATAMNERSSRSHTAIIFYCKQIKDGNMITSQITLVDLAGSERVKKSKVTAGRFQEAIGINSSLLILGKVISALVESKRHVPFYESKLTTMLKAAFGGNCRTGVMIACRNDHGDETLQSLRFGERCGQVSNSLLVAATSAETALETLDDSIRRIQTQLNIMTEKNLTEINAFKKVSESLNVLLHKRKYLVKAANNDTDDNNQKENEKIDS